MYPRLRNIEQAESIPGGKLSPSAVKDCWLGAVAIPSQNNTVANSPDGSSQVFVSMSFEFRF